MAAVVSIGVVHSCEDKWRCGMTALDVVLTVRTIILMTTMIYYFASAAVAVDSSHMTASSPA